MTRLERQLTWLPHGEHAQPLLPHLRRPLLLAGQSGTTFGFASGAGTKDTAESDSQDGKAAPAFSFGAAGTSFPSVASVLGTSNGEGLQQMTQTSRPSHVACSLAIVSPKREHIRWLGTSTEPYGLSTPAFGAICWLQLGAPRCRTLAAMTPDRPGRAAAGSSGVTWRPAKRRLSLILWPDPWQAEPQPHTPSQLCSCCHHVMFAPTCPLLLQGLMGRHLQPTPSRWCSCPPQGP